MKRRVWWILAGIFAVLAGVVIWQMDIPNWQKLDIDKLTQVPRTTVLYDRNGEPFGSLYASENRVWTDIEDIPQDVRNAFIAAEDLRFYRHGGFDLVRIFGALWADIKTMSLSQGASTITQQLIKLTHLTSEKTLSRKAQEIVLATQLERVMDKDEILECYLNVVYFGNGAYGIQTAAGVYFGKSVSDLSLAEAAMLAGIIKSPSSYAPHINPEKSIARRDMILTTMAEHDFISPQQAEQAKREGVSLVNRSRNGGGWYADQVLTEAETALQCTTEEILSAGYAIYTAYDPAIQAQMDLLFAQGVNFPDPASDGTPCQAAMVAMDTETGGILALEGGRSYDVRRGLNRATSIARQPGSAFKPISTYAAAVDQMGYLPTTLLNDTQREFPGGYAPSNAGGNYYGLIPMREALSRSLNVATVGLADEIGVDLLREYAQRFRIPLEDSDANLSLALGSLTYGVSPAKLCAAYCALANGGIAVDPHAILRIESAEGNVRFEYQAKKSRAVKPETAYIITDMLKTAATTGSAKALASVRAPVAGKTGTVSMEDGQTRDIWTAAYTPEIAVCSWMGFDQPDSSHALASYLGGSSFPAKLCANLLKSIPLTGRDFELPSSLRRAVIDRLALSQQGSVLLASDSTPSQYASIELFPSSDLPKDTTSLWDAPEPPQDVSIQNVDGGILVSFSCLDSNAEYLLLRRNTDGDAQVLATLSGAKNEILSFTDTSAAKNAYYEYTVLPRHRLLHEMGVLLTGSESAPVAYSPGGILGRFLNDISSGNETKPPQSDADPLF